MFAASRLGHSGLTCPAVWAERAAKGRLSPDAAVGRDKVALSGDQRLLWPAGVSLAGQQVGPKIGHTLFSASELNKNLNFFPNILTM